MTSDRVARFAPELVIAVRGIGLCDWCADLHFRAYPEQPGSSCNHPECGCWCSQGAGQ